MRRFTAVDTGNGDCTCRLYGHYGKHGTIVIDKVDYIEKEVRKEMAIDYKDEWKKLRGQHGLDTVTSRDGFHISTLGELMDSRIKNTINNREKLMEEFVKERIKTNIDGGNKKSHNVNVVYRGKLLCNATVHKEEFKNWIKIRKEEK